jgi:hypothetical protein
MNMKGILFLILGAVLFMGCVGQETPSYNYEDDYSYDYNNNYEYEYNYEQETEQEVDEYDYGFVKKIEVPEGKALHCIFSHPDGKLEYYFSENEAVLKTTNQFGDWTKEIINEVNKCTVQYWDSDGFTETICEPFESGSEYETYRQRYMDSAGMVTTCTEIDYNPNDFTANQ